MKKSLRILLCTALLTAVIPCIVQAETITSVVMTYQDKVYTKILYGIETDRIKAGEDTDGLRDIGGLLDNLTFQTNGEVTVDKAAVIKEVKNQIMSGKGGVNLDLTKYTPEKLAATVPAAAPLPVPSMETADIPATGPYMLSEASTRFRANEDRAQNIRNAASKINGMVIMPGQLFSCTAAFGPRTVANGYGLGNVISGDTYVKGIGGGICQVSSTLNLAMLRAGVLPLERHNHSHRSSYIASGLDATISGTSLDYKFINPYHYPLTISAVTNGGVISISVYSDPAATGGVVYEPVVSGGKMANTTHVIGKLAGLTVSDRIAYSSRYKQ
ncbi:MAG: VanW family protein [Lachnospiraceae bacterium]|nr:VanW family protein [Lachnospiraceae bacterium]